MKKLLGPLLGLSMMANLWLICLAVGMSRSVHRSKADAIDAQIREATFRSNYFVWEIGINPISTYERESDGATLTLSNTNFAWMTLTNGVWQMKWDQLGPRLLRVGPVNYEIWDMQGDLIDPQGAHWKKLK